MKDFSPVTNNAGTATGVIYPFFLVLFLFFAFTPAFAQGLEVRVGVYDNEPKVFISDSGRPAGIFIDVIEYIAEREGWKLVYVPGTWGEGLDRLEREEIDLMPDVALTSDRDAVFDFHKIAVLSSWFQVYARKGSGIKSVLDLDGKRISVLERSVQEAAFIRLAGGLGLNVNLVALPDYRASFEIVARGEADAAITNRFYGVVHAKKYNLEDTTVIFNPSTLYFAAPEGKHADLLAAIDRHLDGLKQNPGSVYYSSIKKWISEDSGFTFPEWVKVAGFLVLLVLALSLSGSVILRHQVKLRTRELTRYNRQMQIMDKAVRMTTTELDPDKIMKNFIYGVLDLTGFKKGALDLPDGETGNHRPTVCSIADGESNLLYSVTYPLATHGKSIGELHLFSDLEKEIDSHTDEMVRNMCSTTALAIINAGLYKKATIRKEELEKMVGEKTRDLKIAMEKAQEADRIKSAFLATMSHELRTPLNSIIGFTGILLQQLPGPLNEEQKKQMTMVQGSSRHLLALINDVLDISKIEAGQLTLSISLFDVRESIEKIVNMIRPQAEKKGISLDVKIAEDVGKSKTDQRRFEQVLLNLLNNAVKFTEKGFVSLECRAGKNSYLLSVSDSGIGIKPEDADRLFQPFHQVDTGLSRKHEGTGLGLSICRKLLEMMGGSIGVESEFGKGSVFTIQFPDESGATA